MSVSSVCLEMASPFLFGKPTVQFSFGSTLASSDISVTDSEYYLDEGLEAVVRDVSNTNKNSSSPDTTVLNVNVVDVTSCVLDTSDETCDIILEVEGKQLHTSRAVLAHYSPVFRQMVYTDFKEKEQKVIPLPGKRYSEMAIFFNVMIPATPSSPSLVIDDNLSTLLGLADEYQVDHVKLLCQTYIWEQTSAFFVNFCKYCANPNVSQYNKSPFKTEAITCQGMDRHKLANKIMLYFHMCDAYGIKRHKKTVKELLVGLCDKDVINGITENKYYCDMPINTKNELLEALLMKLCELVSN